MTEYIREIEQIAAKCTESQSDGYSQIMRICDAMREQQKYCLGYISKEEVTSPQKAAYEEQCEEGFVHQEQPNEDYFEGLNDYLDGTMSI